LEGLFANWGALVGTFDGTLVGSLEGTVVGGEAGWMKAGDFVGTDTVLGVGLGEVVLGENDDA